MVTTGAPTVPFQPSLFEVTIGHARAAPVRHRFRHRSYMWLFDMDRPPRPAWPLRLLAGFRNEDHLDVRAELAAAGVVDTERIVVLTNLRVLGYVFNPISVYWCYGPGGHLLAHVAEVHNTYGKRHAYVLPVQDAPESSARKVMYVSPFYPVDGNYRIHVTEPGQSVSVSVVLERPGDQAFRAGLTGTKVDLTAWSLLRQALRYPMAPLRSRALIQYQGLRLWRKGMEVQPQ